MSGMEALGAVSSIIAIADAGLKLYNYIESVASADKRLKTVAANLKITCNTVKHVGTIFEKEETAKLVGNGAIETAKVATKECQGVFDELRLAISKSERNKYLSPLREAKLELLAMQLEKLKSSLVLLMSVLNQATSLFNRKSEEEREKVRGLIQSNNEATTKYDELKRSYDLLLSKVAPNPISSPLHFLFNKFSTVETTPPPYDDYSEFSTRALDISSEEPTAITRETLENCSKQVSELLFSIQLITRAMGDVGAATLAHKNAHSQYEEAKASLDALFLGTTQTPNKQPSMVSVFPVTMADQSRFDAQRRAEGKGEERRGRARIAGATVASYEAVRVHPVSMSDSMRFEVERREERRRQGNGPAIIYPVPLPLQQPQPLLPQQDDYWPITTKSKKGRKRNKSQTKKTEQSDLDITETSPPEMIPLPEDDDDDDMLAEPQPGLEKEPTHNSENEWAWSTPAKKSKKDQKKRKQNLSLEEPEHDTGDEKLSAHLLGIGATAAALSAHQVARRPKSENLWASKDAARRATPIGPEIDGGWESSPNSDLDDGLTYGELEDTGRRYKSPLYQNGLLTSNRISKFENSSGDEVDDLLHQWTTLYDDENVQAKDGAETKSSLASWFF